MNLTLPWPPRALNPNTRQHWSALARARGKYRHNCAWAARQQGARALTADRLMVGITFVPPDRRRRDLDNMLASIKSGLDGLADVLGIDDSRWQLELSVAERIGGMVKVEVAPCRD